MVPKIVGLSFVATREVEKGCTRLLVKKSHNTPQLEGITSLQCRLTILNCVSKTQDFYILVYWPGARQHAPVS